MFVCSCLKFAKIFLKLCRKCAFECYFIRLSKQLNGKFLKRKMFIKFILSELSLLQGNGRAEKNQKVAGTIKEKTQICLLTFVTVLSVFHVNLVKITRQIAVENHQ
jgi:hypothetical protein